MESIIEYISLESRWFLKQPIPREIREMFIDVNIETRTDIYWTHKMHFHTPVTTEGIKLREGGFEVKELLKEVRHLDIPGKVEKWRKLRKPIPSGIDLDKDWTHVLKNRQLIVYEILPDRMKVPVSYSPDQGCQVELTTFGMPFEDHWTFGLEAFGNTPDLNSNLTRGYLKCLERCKVLKDILSMDYSYSYPEWLAKFH
jgi:hypothetical protein